MTSSSAYLLWGTWLFSVPCVLEMVVLVTQQLAELGRPVNAPRGLDGGGGHVHGQVRFVRHPPTPPAAGRRPHEMALAAVVVRPGGGEVGLGSVCLSVHLPSSRILFAVDSSGALTNMAVPSP